jgi:hypothetical protein
VNLFLVPSLVAIVAGHIVIYRLKKADGTRGKGIAFAGLIAGYAGLLKELYMYWLPLFWKIN